MSQVETIVRLESVPLLGPSLIEFNKELVELKNGVRPDTARDHVGRILILEARARMSELSRDSVLFLSKAELWARTHELERAACRLRLMWCRAVSEQDPESLPTEVLDSSIAQARALGDLEADWRMALAAAGCPDAQTLLEAAITRLPLDAHAFERMRIWLQLAAIRHDGGDVEGAIRFLKEALRIADTHEALDHQADIASMLGQLYLAQGQAHLALAPLSRALRLSDQLGDALAVVTNGTLVAALHVAAGSWQEAQAVAQQLASAAQRRNNWLAVADACIVQATCLVQEGHLSIAVDNIVQECFRMQTHGTSASINLLKGYLVELRQSVDTDAFDTLFQASVARHTASGQAPA